MNISQISVPVLGSVHLKSVGGGQENGSQACAGFMWPPPPPNQYVIYMTPPPPKSSTEFAWPPPPPDKIKTHSKVRIYWTPIIIYHIMQWLQSCISNNLEEQHIFNRDELKNYSSATTSSKQASIPGVSYLMKILEFITRHYSSGELYILPIYIACY